jgi:hypothetical protein
MSKITLLATVALVVTGATIANSKEPQMITPQCWEENKGDHVERHCSVKGVDPAVRMPVAGTPPGQYHGPTPRPIAPQQYAQPSQQDEQPQPQDEAPPQQEYGPPRSAIPPGFNAPSYQQRFDPRWNQNCRGCYDNGGGYGYYGGYGYSGGYGYGPPIGVYASPAGIAVQFGPFHFFFR